MKIDTHCAYGRAQAMAVTKSFRSAIEEAVRRQKRDGLPLDLEKDSSIAKALEELKKETKLRGNRLAVFMYLTGRIHESSVQGERQMWDEFRRLDELSSKGPPYGC